MQLAICFTNFGPYHLARLRALASALAGRGDTLLAIEVAGTEHRYPWQPARDDEPFEWVTLFPERALEALGGQECARECVRLLQSREPDALAIVGYSRPESMAALKCGRKAERPAVLMSETQEIDHPRVWWKEAVKARRVQKFSAALVGGPRHRDYLVRLGMPRDRIVQGYNAVDNAAFADWADKARRASDDRTGIPAAPYFIAVNRFVPEKNLPLLVRAYARYRQSVAPGTAWDLVLCGDGPGAAEVDAAVRSSGCEASIVRPGFLQADALARWYAHASAFVHPSVMEPWGLVANEAAACRLPLLLSERAGCAETLVPDPQGTTGRRFDPHNFDELTDCLLWMAARTDDERAAMGTRAKETVGQWGPERFAQGTLDALEIAETVRNRRRVLAQPAR